MAEIHEEMSELVDKQVNVQKESLKKLPRFPQTHAKLPQAHEKVCDENERKKETNKETKKKKRRVPKILLMTGRSL